MILVDQFSSKKSSLMVDNEFKPISLNGKQVSKVITIDILPEQKVHLTKNQLVIFRDHLNMILDKDEGKANSNTSP